MGGENKVVEGTQEKGRDEDRNEVCEGKGEIEEERGKGNFPSPYQTPYLSFLLYTFTLCLSSTLPLPSTFLIFPTSRFLPLTFLISPNFLFQPSPYFHLSFFSPPLCHFLLPTSLLLTPTIYILNEFSANTLSGTNTKL